MIEALPFLRWVGGKRAFTAQLAGPINDYLDKTGGHYYEPFLGGGAMALHLGREGMILGDIIEDLAMTFMTVRDEPVELCVLLMEMAEWGSGAEHYYAVRGSEPEGGLEYAARMIYLNAHCFNGLWRTNKARGMNAAYGKEPDRITEGLIERIGAAHESLKTSEIHLSDFERILKKAGQGDLVYVDPPYDGTYVGYSGEGFCGVSQDRLASEINEARRRGVAIISHNSDTEKIRSWYSEFTRIPTKERRSVNRDGEGRGKTNCLLMTNVPELLS